MPHNQGMVATQIFSSLLLILFGVLLQRVVTQWQQGRRGNRALRAHRELEDVAAAINNLVDRTHAIEASVIQLWKRQKSV